MLGMRENKGFGMTARFPVVMAGREDNGAGTGKEDFQRRNRGRFGKGDFMFRHTESEVAEKTRR